MTRKKVKLELIVNDSARKASLKKRRAGLMKKVGELSILCDVSAAVIIYSPDDNEPMMWPSRTDVEKVLGRFNSMPEIERNKKLLNQEAFLNESMSKLEEKVDKLKRNIKELEVSNLMHYVYHGNGLDELNEIDMQSLILFAKEKRNEIKRRIEYQQTPLSIGSPPIATPPHYSLAFAFDQVPRLIPDQMTTNIGDNIGVSNLDLHEKTLTRSAPKDQWFIDLMNNIENITGSSSEAKIDQTAGLSDYDFIKGTELGLVQNMLLPSPPLSPYIGGRKDKSDFSTGMQPYDIGSSNGLQRVGEGNVSGGNIRMPSVFSRDNIAASEVGLPYDVTKQSPANFDP